MDGSGGDSQQGARRLREESGRARFVPVLPLPLVLVSLAIPGFAAWATDDGGDEWVKPLPEPLVRVARDVRVPEPGEGYVDVWGPLEDWEIPSRRDDFPSRR